VRFSDRVGKGVRTAPRDALIADAVPEDQRGAAFGFHRSMDNFGAVLGPLAASGLLLLAPGRYRMVFWCSFIPGLLTVPFLAAVKEKRPAARPAGTAPSLSLKPFSSEFRWYLLCVAVFAFANSSDLFLLQRARELGVAAALVPILYLVLQLLRTFSVYGGGVLGDRFGARKLVLLGWAVYAASYAGFALAGHAWQMWALIVVYGFFYGCTEGPERALVARLAPSGLKATGYGMFNLTFGLIALPANALTGWVYAAPWGGPGLAFSLAGGFALVAALLLAIPLAFKKAQPDAI
jgi:MFS family permease